MDNLKKKWDLLIKKKKLREYPKLSNYPKLFKIIQIKTSPIFFFHHSISFGFKYEEKEVLLSSRVSVVFQNDINFPLISFPYNL